MILSHYVAVGIGGALGSMARVAFSKVLPTAIMHVPVPLLCVNVLGCVAMGILTGLMTHYWSPSDHTRYFLISGFLGGFTTFSGFALDFGFLWQKHWVTPALLYAGLSVVLSMMGFLGGMRLVRWV